MSTSKDEMLREVKMTLRSLIISSTTEMRISELMRDYRENNGTHIPFQDFGYHNLQDFLRTECKDIMKIIDNGKNPVLHPIITESIRHIDELISKQRTNSLRKPKRTNLYNMPQRFSSQQSPSSKINSNYNIEPSSPPGFSMFKRIHSNASNYLTDNKRSDDGRSTPTSENYKSNIITNLKILIDQYPDGIWSADLLNLYSKNFKSELHYEKLGCDSVISLCSKLTDVFTIYRPNPTSDWKLYHFNRKDMHIEEKEKNKLPNDVKLKKKTLIDEALPGIPIDPLLYNDDCLGFNDIIQRPELPKFNEILEVYVTEIVDPSHFWYNIRSASHSLALEQLMCDISKSYNSDSESYKMTGAMARVGQFCLAKYDGYFHRALIINNVDDYCAKVFYIDYGTISVVRTKEIRLLKKEFARLPMQAYRGRLANVAPYGNQWSAAVSNHFLKLVNEKALHAKVNHVDTDKLVCTLDLVDITLNNLDVFINSELHEAGLAKLVNDDRNSLDDQYYLQPSFEDIEKGVKIEAPKEPEIIKLRPLKRNSLDKFARPDSEGSCSTDSSSYFPAWPESADLQCSPHPITNEAVQWIDSNGYSPLAKFGNQNPLTLGPVPNTVNHNFTPPANNGYPQNCAVPNVYYNNVPVTYKCPNLFIPQSIAPLPVYNPPSNANIIPHNQQFNNYNENLNNSAIKQQSQALISFNKNNIESDLPQWLSDLKVDESKLSINGCDKNSYVKTVDCNSIGSDRQKAEISFFTHIEIGGKSLELWKLLYSKDKMDTTQMVLIVEEVLFSLILPQLSIILINDMYSEHVSLKLFCVSHEQSVAPIKRNLMENSHSGVKIGDKLDVNLVNGKDIDIETHLLLIPLSDLVQKLFQYKAILQIDMKDLIKDTTNAIKSHVPMPNNFKFLQ